MFKLFVFAFCVAGIYAQDVMTTKATHVHHEHPETDSFSFYYDGSTQAMLVTTADHFCYIWTLTPDEISAVHSDNGLRNVEVRVMNEIDNALYTVVPQFILNPNIVRSCTRADKKAHTYYLVH